MANVDNQKLQEELAVHLKMREKLVEKVNQLDGAIAMCRKFLAHCHRQEDGNSGEGSKDLVPPASQDENGFREGIETASM